MPSLMASLESNPSWPSSPESSSIWAFPLPLPLLDLLRLLLGGLQAFLLGGSFLLIELACNLQLGYKLGVTAL
jgi:hypothetical protein